MSELQDIANKLDTLIRISAANVVQNRPLREQVRVLHSVGLRPVDIAKILGKKPNHINVTLHEMRNAGKNGGEQNDAQE